MSCCRNRNWDRLGETAGCGEKSRHWLLHSIVSLLVMSLGGISFGQVLDDFDASGVPGVPGLKEEQRTPYWEAIEQQRQVFAEVFQQGWTPEEMTLDLSMPSHDDFLTTGGFTHSGEWFIFDILLAVPLDYHNEDVPAEIQQELDDRQFQWSMVIGRLRGPGGDAPIMGSSVTIEYEGEIRNTLSILERVDDQAFDDIELMQSDYYRVALPACTDENGNIIPTDPEYDTCMDLAHADFVAQRDCLITSTGVGATVGAFLTVGCWGVNLFDGGIASPICWGVTATAAVYLGCMGAQWSHLGDEYRRVRECCCIQLQCRASGGQDCGDLSTCELQTNFCGNEPCLPF